MPSNVFSITISATDKATATIRKINDAMSKVTRPFDDVGKSFKSLGREIGIDKIGKNLQKMGVHARDAAKGIGDIVGPLAGLSGVASVAGIVHLADSWANLGRSITYTAQNIGISTTQLQTFQNAAKLAGISTDAATQSLATLGKTMEDAVWGRNQQALILFDRFTGGVKRTKSGAMDVTAEFKAMAKAIYQLPTAQQQNLLAAQMGMTPWLPMIRQGMAAMNRELSVGATYDMTPAALKSADEFAQSLSKMSLSAKVLGYNVGNALIPALNPLVTQLSTWVDKNRDLISTDIGTWARDFASWVKAINWKKVGGDIHTFIDDIDKVVNALGGVKGILIEIAGIKALSFAGSAAMGLLNIAALTKAMKGLRGAAKDAAAAEAVAAAAGGAPGKAAGIAAAEGGAGLLSKFGWLGGLLRGAMWAPRPAESPEQFREHLKKEGLLRPAHESYWQKWEDVFHWRTNAPSGGVSHPSVMPQVGLAKGVSLSGKITRGERNNNPGNIIYGRFAQRMGATGEDSGGFAIFPSALQGINAIGANLRSYGRKGFNTPFEIAHRWSTTDQDAYTKRLANLFGGNPNQQLDMNDPAVIASLSRGIITQENGRDPYAAAIGPYSQSRQASPVVAGNLHLDVQVTAPQGVSVKATPSSNTTAAVRISHSTIGEAA